MNQGRETLTGLAKEIERQAQSKRDFKAPTISCELSVAPSPSHDILEEESNRQLLFRVGDVFTGTPTGLMHNQLADWAKIPAKYYERMQQENPALLASNVNCWLKQKKETRLVRTLDGKARAFLSKRYRTIDNFNVANAAMPVLIEESKKLGNIETMSCDVTENKMYIKVISKRLTYEIKKGDVVQAGISISNSEVGKGSVRVEPFLYRLICTNGAVISDSAVRRFHLGRQSEELDMAEQVFRDETREADDKAFAMKLQDVIRAAFDEVNFEKLKGITIDATTRKIKGNVEEVVEEVVDRFAIGKYKSSFLRNLIEGADLTQWGVANAVTRIANDTSDYEDSTQLERVGGDIMVMSKMEWETLAAA